jgi:hypothetical protein
MVFLKRCYDMAELGTTTVYGNLYVSNDIHANKIYG